VAGGTIFVLADPRRRLFASRPVAPLQVWWKAALRATYPSTIGLAVLTGLSLAFSSVLAAVLAGVIGGLGVAGLLGAATVFLNRS